MDFLKKKMKEMLSDDNDKEKQKEYGSGDHSRDTGDNSQAQSYYNQPGYGAPAQQGFGGPPSSGAQLPPGKSTSIVCSTSNNATGWIQQWDQSSQRYYYLEQATGRTQWDLPASSHGGPSPVGGYGPTLGHGYPDQFGREHDRTGMYEPGVGNDQYGQGDKDKNKEKSSALKYGLGGAAAGALAGGVIAHEMTEDSDEEGHHVTQSTTYAAAPPASDPYASMPPPAPTENEDGSSVSSSDKEEIEERREDLKEAQEDYNEAVEEGYDS